MDDGFPPIRGKLLNLFYPFCDLLPLVKNEDDVAGFIVVESRQLYLFALPPLVVGLHLIHIRI